MQERAGAARCPDFISILDHRSLEIAALYGKGQAIARREDNAGGPDLDIKLIHYTRLQWLNLLVRMIGPVWLRTNRIKLAM